MDIGSLLYFRIVLTIVPNNEAMSMKFPIKVRLDPVFGSSFCISQLSFRIRLSHKKAPFSWVHLLPPYTSPDLCSTGLTLVTFNLAYISCLNKLINGNLRGIVRRDCRRRAHDFPMRLRPCDFDLTKFYPNFPKGTFG